MGSCRQIKFAQARRFLCRPQKRHRMSGIVMIPLEKLSRHGLVSANNCVIVRLLDYNNSCAGHERAIG